MQQELDVKHQANTDKYVKNCGGYMDFANTYCKSNPPYSKYVPTPAQRAQEEHNEICRMVNVYLATKVPKKEPEPEHLDVAKFTDMHIKQEDDSNME